MAGAARSAPLDWAAIKRNDEDYYYKFHTDDDQLDPCAVLRGIHEIQEAGGSSADEQAFMDRVGFKEHDKSAKAEDPMQRIRLLEAKLDSERAMTAHRVAEAVAAAKTDWDLERAQWQRDLVWENRLLEAVLRKYNVSLPDAKLALVELDAAEPVPSYTALPPPPPPASSGSTPPQDAEFLSMMRDPSYVQFSRMVSKGKKKPTPVV